MRWWRISLCRCHKTHMMTEDKLYHSGLLWRKHLLNLFREQCTRKFKHKFWCPKVAANSQPRFLAFALSNRTVNSPASHTASKHPPTPELSPWLYISFMLVMHILYLQPHKPPSPFQSEKFFFNLGYLCMLGLHLTNDLIQPAKPPHWVPFSIFPKFSSLLSVPLTESHHVS